MIHKKEKLTELTINGFYSDNWQVQFKKPLTIMSYYENNKWYIYSYNLYYGINAIGNTHCEAREIFYGLLKTIYEHNYSKDRYNKTADELELENILKNLTESIKIT